MTFLLGGQRRLGLLVVLRVLRVGVLLGLLGHRDGALEVRLDDLEDADDARPRGLIALIVADALAARARRGHGRLGRSLLGLRLREADVAALVRAGRLAVELLEGRQGLLKRRQTLPGILQNVLVLRLLFLADLGDLHVVGLELGDLRRELRDRLLLALLLGLEHQRFRAQLLGVGHAEVAVGVGLADLRVAPALLGGLVLRLGEEARDELLDQLLNLGEGVRSNLHRQEIHVNAVQLRRRVLYLRHSINALLLAAVLVASLLHLLELSENDVGVRVLRRLAALLEERGVVGVPAGSLGVGHAATHDINGLLKSLELVAGITDRWSHSFAFN